MTWPTADPYRPFTARRARLAALVVGTPTGLLAGFGAILLPPGYSLLTRGAIVALGAAVCWFLYREGSVSLKPSVRGVEVRNLLMTTQLEWAQVVAVRFGGGDLWARLDLASTEVLAVMAIQRSDGEVAGLEAERLAALIEAHGGVEPDYLA